MATQNPFDLLGDDDNDDPSQLIAAQQQKIAAKKPTAPAAAAPPAAVKLPTKPVPPSQAVREARSSTAPTRGGAGRGGPGRGRGGRGGGMGPNRDTGNGNADGFSKGYGGEGRGGVLGGEERDAGRLPEGDRGPRPPFRGGRRGGYRNGEAGGDSERPPRRMYERRSGTGHGYEIKRDGAGRGNWGTATDDMIAQATDENVTADDKVIAAEKQQEQEDAPSSEARKDKDVQANEEEKEPEDKEMTLEEYEKIREEKRKALLALKTEERKVEIDRELQSMQQLSLKKGNGDVFVKLGSDKDMAKKKDVADRDERAKKSVNINEFLKPAEGERYYSPAGRGRGRGRAGRGPFRGGFSGGGTSVPAAAPSIEDPGQFPTLGK
ncbi:RGG repeats nuclear RNA binding protein A-like [Phoenix dactylifera]|uniref:RGG repeats nuclear RNA binding protein A-like n=1 Tax=Phoenix dactylifera TaxID=42345 RepID=A0A8B9APU5_PHODC|nr:RGG repeats nuclear RNA binding protein A-like [Phoenix dactylifera]